MKILGVILAVLLIRPRECLFFRHNIQGVSNSSHLPMEMLIKVFAQLDARTLMLSVPAVCRWWREVYYSSATALDYSWAPAGLVTVRHD